MGIAQVAPYGLIVCAVVLGWQIAVQPLIQRAPVEAAIRVAPGSPLVLRRAAESELTAGRVENAAALSRDALARSPFDVRALRVLGLTEAEAGRADEADEILTLAGNWSLRDDPSHAWLIERRLGRGDYGSAFAHADTLARRRQDIHPQVFRLFTVAGTEDPQRSLPVLASLLAAEPPWRLAFLTGLNQTLEGLQVSASLAMLLNASRAPLTNVELEGLYRALLGAQQLQALSTVRNYVKRPSVDAAVTNGSFADETAPQPFQWRLLQQAGIVAEIVPDDLRPSNPALRVDYDGYATGTVAEQLTFLAPGTYRLSAEIRTETGAPSERLAWTLTCTTGGNPFTSTPAGTSSNRNAWTTFSGQLEVPATCAAQWLKLEARGGDRRSPTVVWFDRIAIQPAG